MPNITEQQAVNYKPQLNQDQGINHFVQGLRVGKVNEAKQLEEGGGAVGEERTIRKHSC